MTRHVAFFRNMNLGHGGSPVRAQLEEAFAAADDVRSFQTNGTVLFSAADPVAAMSGVGPALRASCGYEGACFVRPLDAMPGLTDSNAWEASGDDVYGETLTFVDADPAGLPDLPWTNEIGDLTLLELREGCVLGLSRQIRSGPGDPNSTIERMLDAKATTRSRGTVQRLVRAASSPSA